MTPQYLDQKCTQKRAFQNCELVQMIAIDMLSCRKWYKIACIKYFPRLCNGLHIYKFGDTQTVLDSLEYMRWLSPVAYCIRRVCIPIWEGLQICVVFGSKAFSIYKLQMYSIHVIQIKMGVWIINVKIFEIKKLPLPYKIHQNLNTVWLSFLLQAYFTNRKRTTVWII